MKTKFSIVICTYNRCKILEICLNSVALLEQHDGFDYEVLIVDNNSGDNTRETAETFVAALPETLRSKWSYHHETRQGLSHARNRGIAESRGDWLVFLDDECELEPDWLTRVHRIVKDKAPVMVGGPYRGRFLPDLDPSLYARGYLESYGDSHHLRDNWPEGWLTKPGLSGGNMAIKRDLLEQVGFFDPAFGMTGATMQYGEETELQMRVLAVFPGGGIFYSPDLELVHYIRPEKTGLRASFKSCVQRARNVASLQRSKTRLNRPTLSDQLSKVWILTRRGAGLTTFLGARFIRAGLSGDTFARPIYEAVHSGKLQAFLQIAMTVGELLRPERRQ